MNLLGRSGPKEFHFDSKGAKECKSDRSRQELSNEYLVAKIGFDTAENEPSEVRQNGLRRLLVDN